MQWLKLFNSCHVLGYVSFPSKSWYGYINPKTVFVLRYWITPKWILNLKNPYWSSRVDSRSNLEIRQFRIPTWKAGFLLIFEVWCYMFSLLFVINTGTLNNSFPEFFSFFGCNLCKTLQLNNLILHAFSRKKTYSKEL